MQTLSDHIPVLLRMAVVYLLMFILFLLNNISVSTPILSEIDVPFIIMMLYYWSVYRPTLIPPFLVFCAGICFDLLIGWPVGLNALIFLILRHVISSQRLFLTGQPFMVVWIGFVMAVVVSLSMQWFLFGLTQLQWGSFDSVIITSFIGVLLFPFVSLILNIFHKALPAIQDHYSAVR